MVLCRLLEAEIEGEVDEDDEEALLLRADPLLLIVQVVLCVGGGVLWVVSVLVWVSKSCLFSSTWIYLNTHILIK